jgi:hypothetical protein
MSPAGSPRPSGRGGGQILDGYPRARWPRRRPPTAGPSQTYPLLAYYRRRGILVRIDAVGRVDAITEQILALLHWYKFKALTAGADRPEWAFGEADG